MNRTIRVASGAAAITLAAILTPSMAHAAPAPAAPTMPIVKENRIRPLQPNLLNKQPVCNAWEDTRMVIERAQESFTPVGAIEMSNLTDGTIPLTQTLSRTQTFTASISGDVGGEFAGAVKATVSPGLSYSISWNAGQQIGPYSVPAGKTGRATYGFGTITFDGTRQFCKLNGTWSQPTRVDGRAPIASRVQVQVYDNPIDVAAARSREAVPTEVIPAR